MTTIPLKRRRGRPAGTGQGFKLYAVNLHPALMEQLQQFAIQKDRTNSSVVREAIAEYLERHTGQPTLAIVVTDSRREVAR